MERNDGEPTRRMVYHLCAGTGILPCTMAAKFDYCGTMVDDGATHSLLSKNPWFTKRDNPSPELDMLSGVLHSLGVGRRVATILAASSCDSATPRRWMRE